MSDFVARNVAIIDLSNPRNIQLPEVYQPQSCIIKFQQFFLDAGAHCYACREFNKQGLVTRYRKNMQGIAVARVVVNSLDQRRIPLLRKFFEYAAAHAASNPSDAFSFKLKRLLAFFQFYFNQSDLDYSDPNNRSHYQEAAKRYSAVIRANTQISSSTKSNYTRIVFCFAEFIYHMVELNSFDYDVIRRVELEKCGTTPLLPEELELSLALRTAIFEGVFDLLVNNRKLPYRLEVPAACGELNDSIWLGYAPWAGPCSFPRVADFEKTQCKEWFNRDAGCLIDKAQ